MSIHSVLLSTLSELWHSFTVAHTPMIAKRCLELNVCPYEINAGPYETKYVSVLNEIEGGAVRGDPLSAAEHRERAR